MTWVPEAQGSPRDIRAQRVFRLLNDETGALVEPAIFITPCQGRFVPVAMASSASFPSFCPLDTPFEQVRRGRRRVFDG